jgi:hypothetical protein
VDKERDAGKRGWSLFRVRIRIPPMRLWASACGPILLTVAAIHWPFLLYMAVFAAFSVEEDGA